MTLEDLLDAIDHKSPPAPLDSLSRFESTIGHRLPEDYRDFLMKCNGGYGRGYIRYKVPTVELIVAVNHVGGFREESCYSLESNHEIYQIDEMRIPRELIWIADDPYGNGICLGIFGENRGRVFFWNHENEPDPDHWDGKVASAGNIILVANSFAEFVARLNKVK